MSTLQIHTLAWDNCDPQLLQAHRKVTQHLQIPVCYHIKTVPHGAWIDSVLETAQTEVVGFLDSDCVPLNREIVLEAAQWAFDHRSFIGIAQCSNHIPPKSHIFAAPAFFFICRAAWVDLGKPSFAENPRSDVAQEVSYRAEEAGLRYRTLYPTRFELKPRNEDYWYLGNYGIYGIGTVYKGGVYHLYQGRERERTALFIKRCEQIVAGTFSTDGFHECDSLNCIASAADCVDLRSQVDRLSAVARLKRWLPPPFQRPGR